MERYTVKDFRKQFPTDDACLEWLKNHLYPNGIHCETCQKVTPHYKVASRRSYSCQFCGHHVHPTAGTIYHKSTTPLTDWFYAVYLMASTRCGIAAKQLERELGVTYKTAWRMFNKIRSMLTEGDEKLSGIVEVDETYIGGKSRLGKRGRASETKTIVAGAVRRQGSVITKIIPDNKMKTLIPFVQETVSKDAIVITDENPAYRLLYASVERHVKVNHSKKKWTNGDAHTNTIEGFWSLAKGGLRGVYRGRVRPQHLQSYMDEYAFRYNRRFDQTPMFLSFLTRVQKLSD